MVFSLRNLRLRRFYSYRGNLCSGIEITPKHSTASRSLHEVLSYKINLWCKKWVIFITNYGHHSTYSRKSGNSVCGSGFNNIQCSVVLKGKFED